MRNALENKGFEELPEQDLDSAHFDVKWTLTHDDINFSTLSPPQIVNHYPNSGTELGAKVRVQGSRFRVECQGFRAGCGAGSKGARLGWGVRFFADPDNMRSVRHRG